MKNISVFLLFLSSMSLSSVVNADYSSQIDDYCMSEWGTDYEMVEHCTNGQTNAYHNVQNMSQTLPGEIVDRCKSEWPKDFEMQEHCMNEQSKAHNNLQSETSDPAVPDSVAQEIMARCRSEWGTDYEMVEYCNQEQTSAYKRLY